MDTQRNKWTAERPAGAALLAAGVVAMVGCADVSNEADGLAPERGQARIPLAPADRMPFLGDPDATLVTGEEIPFSDDEQGAILAELDRRGLDSMTASFLSDGRIRVAGDLIVDGADVLESSREPVRKGYKVQGPVVSDVSEIFLVQDPSNPLSSDWTWAFVLAAADYNFWTPVNYNFLELPTDPKDQLTVLRKAPLPTGDPCPLAAGSQPRLGPAPAPGAERPVLPGLVVTINAAYNPFDPSCRPVQWWELNACHQDIEAFPLDVKRKIATHELGHTLGLAHPTMDDPNDPPSEHVPGTATNSSLYPSVMWQGCYGNAPHMSGTLSWDDIATLGAMY